MRILIYVFTLLMFTSLAVINTTSSSHADEQGIPSHIHGGEEAGDTNSNIPDDESARDRRKRKSEEVRERRKSTRLERRERRKEMREIRRSRGPIERNFD